MLGIDSLWNLDHVEMEEWSQVAFAFRMSHKQVLCMKRASSLVPALWICISSSLPCCSRSLQIRTASSSSLVQRIRFVNNRDQINHGKSWSYHCTQFMSSEQDNGEKRPRKRVIKESALEDIGDGVPNKRRGRSAADKKDSDKNTNGDETPTKEPAKEAKAKRVSHQILTERDFLPKLWNSKECEDSSFSKLLHESVRLLPRQTRFEFLTLIQVSRFAHGTWQACGLYSGIIQKL